MDRSDIICISTHYWHDLWFRQQHFMSRFAELGHRILYVQPSFSMVRRSHKPGVARNQWLKPTVERISNRICLFSPPRLFPKPGNPGSSALSHWWFGKLIAREARRLGMHAPVLWIYRPEYATALNIVPHSGLVFDLADDLAAYNHKSSQYLYIAKCIDKLTAKSDLMVVTSPTLHDKYKEKARQCIFVSNGFDSSLFNNKPKDVPADLRKTNRPIIGFVGVLFGFLDYELIRFATELHPDKSFVFVGPVEKSGQQGVDLLRGYSNVNFLGRKPRHEIPAYVTSFDVCLNPFKVDDVSRSVSPLKVYEYLACGKPVVSTQMDGLERADIGGLLYFARDGSDFVELIACALKEDNQDKQALRMGGVQAFSWDNLFAGLNQNCTRILVGL